MSHGSEGSVRAIFYALGANFGIAVAKSVAAQSKVEQVLNVITLAWGDKIVIAVKARMAGMEQITGSEMVRNINAVEARMQAQFPAALWVFFEPDEK